ncbi:MAG: calcium-binding protein, partial [Planctomycetota bacterium]
MTTPACKDGGERPQFEQLEPRLLLSASWPVPSDVDPLLEVNMGAPVDAVDREAFEQGLVQFQSALQEVAVLEQYAHELPLVGTRLLDRLPPYTPFGERVLAPMQAFLDTDPSNVGAFQTFFESPAQGWTYGYNAVTNELSATLSLVVDETAELPVGLDTSAPLDVDGSELSLGLDLPDLNVDADLLLNLTFGVDLDDARFFIENTELTSGLSAAATGFDASATLGFLGMSVVDASVNFSAGLDITFNAGNRLWLADHTGTPISELIGISPSGALNGSFPMQLTAGLGDGFTFSGNPSVDVAMDDVFSEGVSPAFTSQELTDALSFQVAAPGAVLSALDQLANWFGSFGESDIFGLDVPFTDGLDLSALDLRGALIGGLNSQLEAVRLTAADAPSDLSIHAPDLTIRVNNQTNVSIASMGDFASIDALVQQINQSLAIKLEQLEEDDGIDFVGQIEARNANGRVEFVASPSRISNLEISGGEDLGFTPEQCASGMTFGSAQDLASLLANVLGLEESFVDAAYDPLTHELTFTIEFQHTLAEFSTPLGFEHDLGGLAEVSTSSEISLMSTVASQFTFGFLLEELGGDFVLTPDTTLQTIAQLNGFLEFPTTLSQGLPGQDLDDLIITLSNGSEYGINLDSALTVQDVLSTIEASCPPVTVVINQEQARLELTDTTYDPNGSGQADFTVRAANASFAVYALGLLSGAEERTEGEQTRLVIEGTPLHGETLADRMFIRDDAFIEGRLDLMAADIDASAMFGFVEVGIVDGGATSDAIPEFRAQEPEDGIRISVGLSDPNNDGDGKIFLSELTDALGDVSTLVPSPQVTGQVTANLPVVVEFPSIEGSADPMDVPRFLLSWNAAAPADINVEAINLERLLNLRELDAADIISALTGIVDGFGEITDTHLMNLELPLLNKSVSDLLQFSEQLAQDVERFENAPASTLQDLADSLVQQLGLDESDVTVDYQFARGAQGRQVEEAVLRIDIDYDRDFSEAMPLNLDLGELVDLPELGNLVDVGADALLSVEGGVEFDLHLGIDLSNPLAPAPFVYDTTGLVLSLGASASNMDLSAALGPLGLFVNGGHVDLGHPGNINQPAEFTVGIIDNDGTQDGRLNLVDLISSADIGLDGKVKGNLPIDFPVKGEPLDPNQHSLDFAINDLSDISNSTEFTAPDFSEALTRLELVDNLSALVDGWMGLMTLLEEALDDGVLGISLPLIGDGLHAASDFFGEMRDTVLGVLDPDSLTVSPSARAAMEAGEIPTMNPADSMQQALFDGLSDVGWLQDTPDPGTDVDINDVKVVSDDGSVEFQMRLGQQLFEKVPSDSGFDFDLGLPGLGMSAEGEVQFTSKFGFDLGFGINKNDGVYFDFDPFDLGGDDITIDAHLELENFRATGELLFLQLDVTDEDVDGDDKDAYGPSSIDLQVGVDVGGPDDSRLLLTNPSDALSNLAASATLDAEVNLEAVASFGGDAHFPSLDFDFNLEWWAIANTDTGFDFNENPDIWFRDVRMNFGTFIGDFLGPIVGTLGDILEPTEVIVDILTTPIPVISDLGGEVTLADLAGFFGLAEVECVFEALEDINDLIGALNALGGSAGEAYLELGSFQISGDATDPDMVGGLGIGPVEGPATDPLDQIAGFGDLGRVFGDATSVGSGSGCGVAEHAAQEAPGFKFPIIDEPTKAFELLLGGNPSLITYDFPPFFLGFEYTQCFPIFGPLSATITGEAGANFDLGFGYDTFGLRQAAASDFRNMGAVFEGFYIKDLDDDTGEDVPELQLTAGLAAGLELNLAVARAGVEGGIRGEINFNLNDPDGDGKVRVNEIIDNAKQGFDYIFDISGELAAFLRAYLKVVLPLGFTEIVLWDVEETIVDITLFEFALEREDQTPVLAEVDAMGTLNVNIGTRATSRLWGDRADVGEEFILRPGANSGEVIVEAFGLRQTYGGVSRIFAEAGEGHDVVHLSSGLDIAAEIHGGPGNDNLVAGSGPATLYGDGGDDDLVGGSGNDHLVGGEGNDTIHGGRGDDEAEGGQGDDHIFGEGGHDTIRCGIGRDDASGGRGNDQVYGEGDDDWLTGDEDDDLLVGGEGNDNGLAFGRPAGLMGGLGNDTLIGDIGTAVWVAEERAWSVVEDSLSGAGDDILAGESGFDTLYGVGGDDHLVGGTGSDTVFAGAGSDVALGESGNDRLNGGEGDDHMIGGTGSDTIIGGWGSDRIFAGISQLGGGAAGENHTIFGDLEDLRATPPGSPLDHNDFIFGDVGDDTVEGGPGNDEILVYTGSAFIGGGPGQDFIDVDGRGTDIVSVDSGADRDIVDITGGVGPVTVLAGDGQDDIDINADGAAPVTVYAGDGPDDIYIDTGGAAPVTVFAGAGQDGIYIDADGAITVDAGADNDRVTTVGSGIGNIGVIGGGGADIINLGSFSRLLDGGGAVDVSGDGVGTQLDDGAHDDISVFATGSVRVDAGESGVGEPFRDVVTIMGPASDVFVSGDGGSSASNAGEDDIYIESSGAVTVHAGPADDFITVLGATNGAVEIVGDGGSDDIDLGTALRPSGSGLVEVFGDGEDVAIPAGGIDHIDVFAVGVIYVNAAEGGDIVTVRGEAGEITVLGDGYPAVPDGGSDDIDIVGDGEITVQAGPDDDYVEINGAGNGAVYVVGDGGKDDIYIGNDGVLAVGAIDVRGDGEFDPVPDGDEDYIKVYANGEIRIDAGEAGDDVYIHNAGTESITVFGDGDQEELVNGGIDAIDIEAGSGEIVVHGSDLGDDIDILASGDGHVTVYGDGKAGANLPGDGDFIDIDTQGDSLIFADAGDDIVRIIGPGDDFVIAGVGDDHVYAGDGSDVVIGGYGGDVIWGDNEDQDSGGEGQDVIWGGDLPAPWVGLEDFGRQFFDDPTDFIEPPGFEVAEQYNETTYRDRYGRLYTTPLGGLGVSLAGVSWNGNRERRSVGDGQDELHGGPGSDWLFGGWDEDDLDGGAGDDYVDGGEADDYVRGGDDDDVVLGGLSSDVVRGDEGIDQLYGNQGDDFLYGNRGKAEGPFVDDQAGQRLWGGAGVDYLYAFAPTVAVADEFDQVGDELRGGTGGDYLYGNLRQDLLIGGDDNDYLHGDYLEGPTHARNTLAGVNRPDGTGVFVGSADRLVGGFGQDQLYGGGGNDTMFGGRDSDLIEGQDGNDRGYGGNGVDLLILDVDGNFEVLGDDFDGFFGNQAEGDVADAGEVDILVVEGDKPRDEDAGGPFALDDEIILTEEDVAITGDRDLPLEGRLSDNVGDYSAEFDLTVAGEGVEVLTVTVSVPNNLGNQTIDELIADVGAALTTAISEHPDGEQAEGKVEVVRIGDRIRLQTVGLGAFADLVISETNDLTNTVLGIEENRISDASITGSQALPADGEMGGPAMFTLTINGQGIDNESIDVEVLDEAASIPQLINAVGDAIAQALGDSDANLPEDAVQAVRIGNRLRLQTNNLGGSASIRISAISDPLPPDINIARDVLGFAKDQTGTAVSSIAGVQLINVDYGGRSIVVGWRDSDANPLVEQFQISGLMGDDRIEAHLTAETIEQLRGVTPGDPWVTVLSGGPGWDEVLGSAGRDSINGGPGSDMLFGFAGNDRIWGAEILANLEDHDLLFAGQGNDDLVGGRNTNEFYAWSIHPEVSQEDLPSFNIEEFLEYGPSGDFGVFVDDAGVLQLHNPEGTYQLEDTGLNRMLGTDHPYARDFMFGGTGLDFMFGNGGAVDEGDRLITRNGEVFQDADGVLSSDDAWKDYARDTGRVWYLGASATDDVIEIDFVTNPFNPFFGRHLVTLSTDGSFDPRFSGFDNVTAYDSGGDPAHEMVDERYDAEGQSEIEPVEGLKNIGDDENPQWVPMDRHDRLAEPFELSTYDLIEELLGEEEFLAIIIDALGGEDEIIVGETVQTSVWVDAGAGDDIVRIEPQLSYLPDATDMVDNRNDTRENAYPLGELNVDGQLTGRIAVNNSVFTGLTIDSARADAPDIDWYSFILPSTTPGDRLEVVPLSDNPDVSLSFSLENADGHSAGEAAVIGSVPLPIDGRLGLDVTATFRVYGTGLFSVADDPQNQNRQDLIDDINEAIYVSTLNASLDGERLRIETVDQPFEDPSSLRIDIEDTNLAANDILGLTDHQEQVCAPLLSGLYSGREYRVRVESVGNVVTDYALIFSMASLEDSPDRQYDSSGDPLGDTRETAFQLDEDRPINRIDEVVGLTLHETLDEDWYRFSIGETAGTNPVRLISYTPNAQVIIELYVTEQDGTVVLRSSDTAEGNEFVDVTFDSTGAPLADDGYYIRVYPDSDADVDRARYDLALNIGSAVPSGTSLTEPFELPALDLILPVVDDSLEMPGAESWYQLTLQEPARPGEGIGIRSVEGFSDLTASIYQVLNSDFLGQPPGSVTLDDLIYNGRVTNALATVMLGELVDLGSAVEVIERGARVLDLADLGPDTPDTAVSYLIQVSVTPRDLDGDGNLDQTQQGYELYSLSSSVVATRLNLVAGEAVKLYGRETLDRRDVILGGTGNDRLQGGTGEDWVLAGDGNDVLTGGLDHQASDLLFGGAGDDIFQLMPDRQPEIPATGRFGDPRFREDVKSGDAALADILDGGAGDDQVLYLGGDMDETGMPIRDFIAVGYDRFLHRY